MADKDEGLDRQETEGHGGRFREDLTGDAAEEDTKGHARLREDLTGDATEDDNKGHARWKEDLTGGIGKAGDT